MKHSEGSSWSIWDFHVHTPWSLLNNQFGDPDSDQTWARYLRELDRITREKNIVALGITDYFCFDGYMRVVSEREKAKKEALDKNYEDYLLKDIFLFPNIEFRILPVTSKGKSINLHVLFNPKIVDIIETDFLSNLKMEGPDKIYKCVKSDLILLGKSINRSIADDNIAYKEGMNQFKTNIDSVKKALESNKSKFNNNAIIAIGNNEQDGLAGLAEDALLTIRRNICYHADMILSPREVDRNFYLGKDKRCSLKDLTTVFNGPKPCIHGSDAHRIEDLCSPSLDKYCWIKAQPSWEGLRQILYEPEDRVVVQVTNPENEKNYYTIKNIQIPETNLNNDLKITKVDQRINSNLVAIIGGRGSGKTALLDLIASCFQEGTKLFDENHPSSFVQRALSKNAKGRSVENIPINIKFLSGENFTAEIGENAKYFPNADVDYLTQNHFEEISSNTTRLHDYILELFFNAFPDDRARYFSFEEEMQKYQEEINRSILEMVILLKKVETNMPTAKVEEQQKIGELNDYQLRINNLEGINSDLIKMSVKEISESLMYLEEEKENTQVITNQIHAIINLFKNFWAEYENQTNIFNDSVIGNSLYSVIDIPAPSFSQVLEKLQDNLSIAYAEEIGFTHVIEILQDELISFEGVEQELASFYNKKKEIQSELEQIKKKIKTLSDDQKEVNNLKVAVYNSFIMMLEETKKQKAFLNEVIAKFESIGSQTLRNVSFVNSISFSKIAYLEQLNEDMNLIKSRNQAAEMTGLYEKLIDATETNENLEPIITQIGNVAFSTELKRSVDRQAFIMHLFDRSFKNILGACLQGKPLENLSMGERAVVLLKIVLSLGDKPLLIDQPEEHLDNRYVYTELVPTIREIRTKRQIIIATHNANLVVNTDAEQIIVADYSNGNISYTSGGLENIEIKESIKSILEGGDEAFKKREQKYNLA